MLKNTAGQSVGAQLINVADGSPFTGQARVFVTIDNGIQTVTPSGSVVHEGLGYHSYTPTQAETNGEHIAFTFDDAGGQALVVTVQIYTEDPTATIIIPGTGTACDSVWKATLVSLLRTFVGDFTSPPTYSDDRMCQLLGAAAFYVSADICDCPTISFTYDISTGIGSPDPLNDATIANLIVLKAACVLDQGLSRTRSISEGVKAVCGPASLQVLAGSSSFRALFDNGPCAAYEDLMEGCCFRNPIQTAEFCKIVLSPFVSENFIPCNEVITDNCCDIQSPARTGRVGGGGGCCNTGGV